MKLVLGVVDIPYAEGSATTGEVAELLEKRYHVMAHFAERHKAEITKLLCDEMQGALVNLMMGGPTTTTPLAGAMDKIQQKFVEFLNTEEMAQTGELGVPTRAALEGVQTRLKSRKGSRRPSFVDTHLYRDTMKAWSE